MRHPICEESSQIAAGKRNKQTVKRLFVNNNLMVSVRLVTGHVGLPKQTELSADELLRQEESHRSTSPSKRWIPPG